MAAVHGESGVKLITDREIYEEVILGIVPSAEKFLWLATADLKDLHVDKGDRMVPFLEIVSDLIEKACRFFNGEV